MDEWSGINAFRAVFPTAFAVAFVIAYWIDPQWTSNVFLAMVEDRAAHIGEQLLRALQPALDQLSAGASPGSVTP